MSFFSEAVSRLIGLLYEICGDYGIAIVWITIVVRLILLPLNIKQNHAVKRQQKLGERAEEIKKKHRKNTEKMNAELEKLYQSESALGAGCLLTLLQFPIMLALYHGIRFSAAVDASTVLLPWIPSLMERDGMYILPVITVFVQAIPLLMPYFRIFKRLNLQKTGLLSIAVMLFINGWFAFLLPSGIELYYMVSGLFTAAERIISSLSDLKRYTTNA